MATEPVPVSNEKDPKAELKAERIVIPPPNYKVVEIPIVGLTDLMMNRFPAKAQAQIRWKQEQGSTAAGRKNRTPKNFKELFEASQHRSIEGWHGWPASAFRNAMIAMCRLTDMTMTKGKISLWVLHDGFDAEGTPLVRITKGIPVQHEGWARNETGVVDIRSRARFLPGWEMTIRVEYDADQLTATDIGNLMLRAGKQNGIGDGRPNSRRSNGLGWGTFTIKNTE